MRWMRSRALFALCVAGLGVLGNGGAAALDYPTRPVRWIVSYTPGGGTDITARIMAQWLSERLGQQFVIENKPGGGNNIGTEAAIHSPADGYTVFLVNPANAINATLYPKLAFNFMRDMAPVAGIMRVPNVMEVNRDCRRGQWRSSSPTPRPIRARSTGRPRATAPRCISPASCSRS
jgi:tripartite-type tricarboxylate transporter receptor subunit TctC